MSTFCDVIFVFPFPRLRLPGVGEPQRVQVPRLHAVLLALRQREAAAVPGHAGDGGAQRPPGEYIDSFPGIFLEREFVPGFVSGVFFLA